MTVTTEPRSETPAFPPETTFVSVADQYLDELSQLADSADSHQQFYKFLVERIQALFSASCCRLYVGSKDSKPVSLLVTGKIAENSCQNEQISDVGRSPIWKNEDSLLAVKITGSSKWSDDKWLALGYDHRPDSRLKRLYSDLLLAVAQIAENYERRSDAENSKQQMTRLFGYVHLLKAIHQSIDFDETAVHAVNESRKFLNADRVWLFSKLNKTRLVACSSVAEVSPRSVPCIQLTKAVGQADLQSGIRIFKTQNRSDSLFDEYMAENQVDTLYLLTFSSEKKIDCYLCIDFFETHDQVATTAAINYLQPEIAAAIKNAKRYSDIPLRSFISNLAWLRDRLVGRRWFSALSWLVVSALLLGSLFFVPVEFQIPVQGYLQPVEKVNVFAPADGIIDKIFIEENQLVEEGSPLFKLVSPDYDLKIQELQSEISAANKQLEANHIFLADDSVRQQDAVFVQQLSAEIEQNTLQLKSLNEQLQWHLKLRDRLAIESPLSGQVITTDIVPTLFKRPVQAGNLLSTIAATESAWQIELKIPELEFGYMRNAKENGIVDQWTVEYRIDSDLDKPLMTTISNVSPVNLANESGDTFIRAFAPLGQSRTMDLRVGQSVSARISCGQRSVFFVLTRDVRDFLRRQFMWN